TLNYTNSTLGVANAQFEKIRFGNSFSFTNKSTHSEKYTWAFGDGNTDTVAYPTHEYGIGQHIVSLKVENSCGSHIQTD
ncbi:PKD domain-containing protein, partial [Pseudomonas sp. AH2 (2023)]|uniref:PKD domain-containing protein n=1 Tax=Pseudomonas sp. AH2 (2023) TaxID=3048599 RepID=UPI002B225CE0